jgi:hypothetical protein
MNSTGAWPLRRNTAKDQTIMPAATLSLVISSIMIKLPTADRWHNYR